MQPPDQTDVKTAVAEFKFFPVEMFCHLNRPEQHEGEEEYFPKPP
jgi:hypothetical protein